MAGGRPTDYDEMLAAAICELTADGKSLKEICDIDGFPTRTTVYRWFGKYPEFNDMWARAKTEQAHTITDELIPIADGSSPENATVDRLRIETRKWISSKLLPKVYGDKLTNEMVGADGGPIGVAITVGYKDGSG